jgi:hypothetical protein
MAQKKAGTLPSHLRSYSAEHLWINAKLTWDRRERELRQQQSQQLRQEQSATRAFYQSQRQRGWTAADWHFAETPPEAPFRILQSPIRYYATIEDAHGRVYEVRDRWEHWPILLEAQRLITETR